ncbi:MAG TPA: hypothetical protein VGC32_17220 [Solirubrobacterales bacterium]
MKLDEKGINQYGVLMCECKPYGPPHVALLRHANVRWSEMEWGAPEIDGKRPYGNGDLPGDIAKIIGLDIGGEMDEATRADLLALHAETETALQVILASGSFTPGFYRTSGRYGHDWRLDA